MELSLRKVPRQARSSAMVDTILEAAARVLAEEGLGRATTNRIAEVAGVSIGSLYQYFPNKLAIVRALQIAHGQATSRSSSPRPWSAARCRASSSAICTPVGSVRNDSQASATC